MKRVSCFPLSSLSCTTAMFIKSWGLGHEIFITASTVSSFGCSYSLNSREIIRFVGPTSQDSSCSIKLGGDRFRNYKCKKVFCEPQSLKQNWRINCNGCIAQWTFETRRQLRLELYYSRVSSVQVTERICSKKNLNARNSPRVISIIKTLQVLYCILLWKSCGGDSDFVQ